MSGFLISVLTGLIVSCFAAELLGWCPAIARLLVNRAAASLPEEARNRYRREWNAEIDILERTGRKISSVGWALMVLRGSRELRKAFPHPSPTSGRNLGLILLYQFALYAAYLISFPILFLTRSGRYHWQALRGRLVGSGAGRVAPPESRPLWIHAVSLYQMHQTAHLLKSLPSDQPVLVTFETAAAREHAIRLFGDRARIDFLPFDFFPLIRRFLRRHRPSALAIIEGTYWPALFHILNRQGIPIVVVSGQVSKKSLRRISLFGKLARTVLSGVSRFGVANSTAAHRLTSMGVAPSRIAVTGNLAFYTESFRLPALESTLLQLASGRPILTATATHGEEVIIVDAFESFGGGRRALLVLAPRHPDRWNEAFDLITTRGLKSVRRSQIELLNSDQEVDILLLDSLGEVNALYSIATATFVGGSLTTFGGTSPVEPASRGIPIAVGPHTYNFRYLSEELDDSGGWVRVNDARELARIWNLWLDNPAAANQVGANAKSVVLSVDDPVHTTLAFLQDSGFALAGDETSD